MWGWTAEMKLPLHNFFVKATALQSINSMEYALVSDN